MKRRGPSLFGYGFARPLTDTEWVWFAVVVGLSAVGGIIGGLLTR